MERQVGRGGDAVALWPAELRPVGLGGAEPQGEQDYNKPGYHLPSKIRRQVVAADVSRRILTAAKMAPTDVGGYLRVKAPGEAVGWGGEGLDVGEGAERGDEI